MNAIAKNLHYVILALFVFLEYSSFGEHQDMVVQLQSQIPPIQNKIKKKEKRLKDLKTFEANLEASKLRVKEVSDQIIKVQKQLPTEINDSVVLNFIAEESGSINVRNMRVSPKLEQLNDFYFSKGYEYEGTGTYLQFLVFFERLNAAERLYNINSVSIQQTNEEQKGRFFLVDLKTEIESYRYNSDYRVETGIEEKK
jgi:Tfp pilus assembly protein PilO